MRVRFDKWVWVSGLSLALMTVAGCRSTKDNRIRALEGERNELKAQNESLRRDVADARSREAAADRDNSEERARWAEERRLLMERRMAELDSEPADNRGLKDSLERSGFKAEMRGDGVVVVLPSKITFRAGRADLTKKAAAMLKDVVKALKANQKLRTVSIEGHTDSDPIRKSGWASNKELSRARAEKVRRFFLSQGVEEDLMSVQGFGADKPVAPNDTKANKALNRRVEIVLKTQ